MPENAVTQSNGHLFEPTEVEQAEINLKRASVIAQRAPAGAPDAYVGEDEVRLWRCSHRARLTRQRPCWTPRITPQ